MGVRRRLHNDELHNLYAAANIVDVTKLRRIRWEGKVEQMDEVRDAYKILIGNPERKGPL
jgi:hypothetical protein